MKQPVRYGRKFRSMDIYIRGASATKFGELWGESPRRLARTAMGEAMVEAEVERDQVEALFVGNMLSGMLGGQEHLGAFFSDELELFCPAFKIEGACASGGLAVHAAIQSLRAGQYGTVAVLGIEKMTDHKPEDVAGALMGAGSDAERMAGATFPGLYALLARAHMEAFGTTEEDLATVAVQNHYHGTLNPKAQYRIELTVEKVMKSAYVADPLKLYDCSPITDGAAALILSGRPPAGRNGHPGVRIIASEVATDTLGVSSRTSLTELKATSKAAQNAYRVAGIAPKEIRVAEVHDCFTIAQLLAMEDLGFFPKGEAVRAIHEGLTRVGSNGLVINPSGGLKACGHPVGATGVKQIVEIADQLRGRCDKRQVEGITYGLTHNVGGSGATAVVHILAAESLPRKSGR